jgi:GrpB-like predicted nucleotidyltransferase (UPF0157 family)
VTPAGLASRDHAVRAKGESEQAFAAGTVVIGRERFDALWWAYLRARRRQPPRPRPAAALSDLAHGLRGDLPGGPRCAIVGVMTVDEPVELVAYDAAWPGRFARERRRLRTRIKRVARIEHIGSTAVPGLASKPIIDIMIGLDPADVDVVAEQIAAAGYTDLGEAGVPGRRHLRRRTPSAYNVHMVELGGQLWRDNLAVRDYLCRHPSEAARYADAKRQVIASAPTLLAYSNRKAAVVEDLVRRSREAQAAAAGLGNTPSALPDSMARPSASSKPE